MNFIGKILPVDGFTVDLHGNLPVDYTKSLTHLYLPLLGMGPVILFQTLLNEIEIQEKVRVQTHHTLMNYLNISLVDIYEARLKLEGIGLLKTFEERTGEKTVYHYILQSPFSPEDFFRDAMLSQLLYHHIGEDKFALLQSHYVGQIKQPQGRNVTVSFGDVFDTIQSEHIPIQNVNKITESTGPQINTVDFTWMEHVLKTRMIPYKRVLTPENKRIINQMMQLYGLAEYEVEKCVLWALTDENKLDIKEFKEACHDMFKASRQEAAIQLVPKSEANNEQVQQATIPKEKMTKEEQLVQHLETISPKQLLEDLSSGNHASEQDLKVIREIMTTQGLPSPVMNVLIHYVLLQTNMKLSKAYLEKIASHWSRANLKTAREAMTFAKKEIEQYRKSTEKKQQNYRNYRRNQGNRTEVIPDWFKERKQSTENQRKKKQEETENNVESIDAMLKSYLNASKK